MAAMNRRRFLHRGAQAATTCACTFAGLGCGTVNPNARSVNTPAQAGRVALGKALDLKIGDQLKVTVAGEDAPVLVARVSDTEVKAISIACSHYGSELAFTAGQTVFVCTDHGSEFNFDGTVAQGPADEPLTTWPVVEEDGQLFLITS